MASSSRKLFIIILCALFLFSSIVIATLTPNAMAITTADTNASLNNNNIAIQNSTSDTHPPALLGPSTQTITTYQTNSEILPSLGKINVSACDIPPTLIPIPTAGSNGTVSFANPSSPDSQARWWITDYWNQPSGLPYGSTYPLSQSGIFQAVGNTVGGMSGSDGLLYMPLNIDYGTTSAYTWIQFIIDFGANQVPVTWNIEYWYEPSGTNGWTGMSELYIPGHVYVYSISPYSSTLVLFTIVDENQTTNHDSHLISVPSDNTIVVNANQFSPASSIEGKMDTSDHLTNVPYFQTLLNLAGIEHYTLITGTPNSGVTDAVYTYPPNPLNSVYWSMLSETYISSIVQAQTGGLGYGSVNNAGNIIGTQYSNYATIYGGNYGDGGQITGQMNAPSGGKISIYGCSVSGYYSNLYVYVSWDDSHWYQIGSSYITITSTTPYWINVGSYRGSFNYIAIVGYDTGNSVNLHLYTVKVGT